MKVLVIAAAAIAVLFPTINAFNVPGAGIRPVTQLYSSPATGTGPGLQYNPDAYADPNNANLRKLSDALNAADVEERLAQEEAYQRENAAEIRRQERQQKIDFMKNMPDNTPAGTVDEYMYKEGVREILDRLDTDLVGLLPVKQRVREIAALLILDKMRGNLGFETAVPSLHMSFTGAPGTGKTTVAIRMGQILQRMGYSRRGHVIVATRDDLVGQYVGHTAPKTKEMIKQAFGGVLLVDEAYYLYNAANEKDYGQESIEILLNVMENNKDDLVVVLAGYKDRMDRFFSYIPGMSSRIGNHIDFPNYETNELVEIAEVMARELEYVLAPGAQQKFLEYIELRMRFPFFSNARTVRNAMDRARMNSAIRLFQEGMARPGGMVTKDELQQITVADFQQMIDELKTMKEDAIVA
uniref:AAA+ ATPase domain-containing protein n=1 Tax=Fibrocapsa japonica TaxID=94617 RepID=A0A6U1QIB9_9STRA|mmetsp:Transcript_9591/g.14723  ORF Transcript_9591/g.14723 Transcript_9591/m.14723 type:complete len:411 (+) Transcript_9591:87-1319(+)|eukprot:CAMPEP_0113937642 /NCGR_PEP_ID=MMETSP1339-20121228/4218_1 /TAXON_ID=94617 /ORGANISM="Fibrocapsa japonica" /LENGTH=410 /DNA_ID=CAMNT_0000940487 /DNA_START=85 /DNA_END=1317 /DNA_ORIENTATION=- /assembly_acc=CAM_ASM_000762